MLLLALLFTVPTLTSALAADAPGTHEGVASCGGSTCHGRLAPTGKTVRQNELITWQDTSSAAGTHSQAWQVQSHKSADHRPAPGSGRGAECQRVPGLP